MMDIQAILKGMHAKIEGDSLLNDEEKNSDKDMNKKDKKLPLSYPSVGLGANIVRMPLWRDFERAAPSCVLRSALFGVVQRGRRRYLDREQLANWGNDAVSYTGQRLDQSDLDVWLELLHLVRDTPLGQAIEFEKYSMLRRLGRSTGSKDWKWLESSLTRMKANSVEIKTGTRRYFGSLIQEGYIDDETRRYVIILNPKLTELFLSGYTLQHTEKRRLLSIDLAKWLCGYLESHKATEKNPHRISVHTLHSLCGSETKELWKFRQSLKKSADQLKLQGIINHWAINDKDIFEAIK